MTRAVFKIDDIKLETGFIAGEIDCSVMQGMIFDSRMGGTANHRSKNLKVMIFMTNLSMFVSTIKRL